MEYFLNHWMLAPATRLAGILLTALLLVRLLKSVTRRLVVAKPANGQTRAAQMREAQLRTMAGLLSSAGTWLIIITALLTALPEFGVNITPIAAAAGVASVALGFGAQNLVRDWINGIVIVTEDQFIVGDLVQIGETIGRVEFLSIRHTVLRLEVEEAPLEEVFLRFYADDAGRPPVELSAAREDRSA